MKTSKILATMGMTAMLIGMSNMAVAAEPVAKIGTVNISSKTVSVIKNDTVVVTFQVKEVTALANQKQGQEAVNRKILRIRAAMPENTTTTTLSRNTAENGWNQKGQITTMQTTQIERVTAKISVSDKIIDAIEKSGGAVTNARYTISQSKKEAELAKIQEKAIKKWMKKADDTTRILKGKSCWA